MGSSGIFKRELNERAFTKKKFFKMTKDIVVMQQTNSLETIENGSDNNSKGYSLGWKDLSFTVTDKKGDQLGIYIHKVI